MISYNQLKQPQDSIQEVWSVNFQEQMQVICRLIKNYPFIAFDTEFPGVCFADPRNTSKGPEEKYQELKANVDALNMIQFGISLSDHLGNQPEPVHTWQFNLQFSLK